MKKALEAEFYAENEITVFELKKGKKIAVFQANSLSECFKVAEAKYGKNNFYILT